MACSMHVETYNVIVSFHTGFNEALMVLVFFLTLSTSGTSFNLTYGSLKPFGSIGMRFRPCLTVMIMFLFSIKKKNGNKRKY